MKILKYCIAALWLIVNLVGVFFIFGHQHKESYCPVVVGEQTSCKQVVRYGWPEKAVTMHDTEIRFNGDALRVNTAAMIIFLIPSLLGAIVIRKVAERANTRN